MLIMCSIVRMGVGYDRLDRVALAEKGVTVCNVPGKNLLNFGFCRARADFPQTTAHVRWPIMP